MWLTPHRKHSQSPFPRRNGCHLCTEVIAHLTKRINTTLLRSNAENFWCQAWWSTELGVKEGRKPQSMFCVSVKPWLHSDTLIWAPFSWTQRELGDKVWGDIWNFSKGTGLPWLGHQIMGHKGPSSIGTQRARTPLLLYSKHRVITVPLRTTQATTSSF